MNALKVDFTDRDGATVVSFTGEAGMMNEEALKKTVERVSRLHPKRLILDLAKLTFISSLAIGLLVTLEKDIKSHGGRVSIAAANNDVGKVIQRCKLDTIMPVFGTVEEAIS